LKSLPRKRSRNEIEATAELQQSRTPASVVGVSDASGDLLWESEMRLRRDKAGYAVGRPRWRSSFLGDPGATFLCGKLERGTKEKSSKKERKEGLWKLTLLEKSLAKDARLFHGSHRPNNKDLSTMYCRQRSTLRRLNFGPKDGERLSSLRTKRTTKRLLQDCWGRGLKCRPLPQTPSPARRCKNAFTNAEAVSKKTVPS
jgi:hypothetical protein